MQKDDKHYMQEAIKEAKKAFVEGEVPIGAIIVCNNKIIARAHNQVEILNDSTAHAEILAITAAENFLGSKYLDDCTMYVTVEPCVMCAGAIHWSHIGRIVYGSVDPKKGYSVYNKDILKNTDVSKGVLSEITTEIMVSFFEILREK